MRKHFHNILNIIFIIFLTYSFLNLPFIYKKINYQLNNQNLKKQKTKIIKNKQYKNNTLIIPALGIETPIIFSKTNNEQEILKKLGQGIVHFPFTANPGKEGNAVFIGHSSNFFWKQGNYNAIFANLNQIKKDDLIYIAYKNKLFKYYVSTKFILSPQDLFIFNQTKKSTITLLTCWPPGTTFHRLAIKGVLKTKNIKK